MQSCNSKLLGPQCDSLPVTGKFLAQLTVDGESCVENVYVLNVLSQPLLGWPAIKSLLVLKNIQSLSENEFVKKYPSMFTELGTMKCKYDIKLKDGANPFCLAAPRRVLLPLQSAGDDEIKCMLDNNVISLVTKPTDWCAGIVVLPKKDGQGRICVDYTHLNKNVLRERHMLLAVDEALAKLVNAKVFSKLDAKSGFWQIPLSSQSKELTIFISPRGRFCFNRLPFGISSAPEFFQREMSNIPQDLDGVICHMDDVLIFGSDEQEHDRQVCAVLDRLRDAGVTLNEKCEFSVPSINYLGHVTSAKFIAADPDKIAAIRNFPPPTDVSGVRRFLELANQLSKFISGFADKTAPLRVLLKASRSWSWADPQKRAFEEIKSVLTETPTSIHYDPNLETVACRLFIFWTRRSTEGKTWG